MPYSPNWQHRKHNGISSSCPATCQLFWAGHHIRGNWRKTETPKINTATLRRKKALASNVELLQMLNRCGNGIAYSPIKEINIALCLQKMALTPYNEVPLSENIQAYVNAMLAWDDIYKLEETLSGAGTSH